MEIVGIFLILFLHHFEAYCIDHYTVINIQNGNGLTKAKENGNDETIINDENLPPFQKCMDTFDTYSKTLKDIISKLENVSHKLIENQATINKIVNKVDIEAKPRDCAEVHELGYTNTGVYTIYPKFGIKGFQVRCDMDTTPGGWTVIQRRVSDSDFFKTWKEYESGFGNVNDSYWLGNQAIHMISSQGKYKLRVDLTSMENEKAYAEYDSFSVQNAASNYLLRIGKYSGNAGDSLRRHNNNMFSTKDRDHDKQAKVHCAQMYFGGWWYEECHDANLNGDYGNKESVKGLVWRHWKGYSAPLKETEMKIRPE